MSLLTEKAKCAEEMAMVKQELEWTKNDARAHATKATEVASLHNCTVEELRRAHEAETADRYR
jgi:hypothetical protein